MVFQMMFVFRHKWTLRTLENLVVLDVHLGVHPEFHLQIETKWQSMGVTRVLKAGRFLQNPGFSKICFLHSVFSRSISKIFFCIADFHGQFQRYFSV
jgi:hypothetical protein